MNIIFDGRRHGFGNNGGSRTIIKCAEVLNRLGHKCYVVGRDNFTWFKHEPTINKIPKNVDAIIAVSAGDSLSLAKAKASIKAWYIRAHEIWWYNEAQLAEYYRDKRFINIVNSSNLKNKLKSLGADSTVIYQGIDFDWWEDRKLRRNDIIKIGALYSSQPRKRWKDFIKLANILGTDKYEYVAMGGSKLNTKFKFISKFIHNANVEQLNDLYNSCHIWFAPTELEGLHNVPMEAALCGCLIVCGDEPMNGMIYDYAFPDSTAMVYERKNIDHAAELIKNPNWNLIENMQKRLRDNIRTREDNMKKLVKYLENL